MREGAKRRARPPRGGGLACANVLLAMALLARCGLSAGQQLLSAGSVALACTADASTVTAVDLKYSPLGDGTVLGAAGCLFSVPGDGSAPRSLLPVLAGAGGFTARSIALRADGALLYAVGTLNGTGAARALYQLAADTLEVVATERLAALPTLPPQQMPLMALTADGSRALLAMTSPATDWANQLLFSLNIAGWTVGTAITDSPPMAGLGVTSAGLTIRSLLLAPAASFAIVVGSLPPAAGANDTAAGAGREVLFRLTLGDGGAPQLAESAVAGEAGACLAAALSPDAAALYCFGSAAGNARLAVHQTGNLSLSAAVGVATPVPGAACAAIAPDLATALVFGYRTAWRFALGGTPAAPTAAFVTSVITPFTGGAAACAVSPDLRAAALLAASPPTLHRFVLENGTAAASVQRPVGVVAVLNMPWPLWSRSDAARAANNAAARLALAAALRLPEMRVEFRSAASGSVRLAFLVNDRLELGGARAVAACDDLLRRAIAGQLPWLGPFPLLRASAAKPGIELDFAPDPSAPAPAGGDAAAGSSGGGIDWWKIGLYILAGVAGFFFLVSLVLAALLSTKRRSVGAKAGAKPRARLGTPPSSRPAEPAEDDATRI